MKSVDQNFRYRQCAIHCVAHGRKNDGHGQITWESLHKRFGEAWETYAHELMVKGVIHGAVGFFYLTASWQAMTPQQQMEEINKLYPRRAQ